MAEKSNEKNKVKTVLENGNMVMDDGSIQLPRKYKNVCENCNQLLLEGDKYCRFCGTKRGEGSFYPSMNASILLYGPVTAFFYKCKKCKHIWKHYGVFRSGLKYCPNCGATRPSLYYDKTLNSNEENTGIITDPTHKDIFKYKIKKIKQKISNIFKKEKKWKKVK